METVSLDALALPPAARAIPPRPPGYGATRESFDRRTGVTFDPVAPAETAAALTFGYLLDPARAARLVVQSSLDPSLPGLDEVFARTEAAITARPATPYHAEIRRAVWGAWVQGLHGAGGQYAGAAPAVRAQTAAHPRRLGRPAPPVARRRRGDGGPGWRPRSGAGRTGPTTLPSGRRRWTRRRARPSASSPPPTGGISVGAQLIVSASRAPDAAGGGQRTGPAPTGRRVRQSGTASRGRRNGLRPRLAGEL